MKNLKKAALGMAMALAFAGAAHAEGRTISVATDATFMPFEFQQDGKMTGFDVELVEALAKKMGDTVKWTQIDFKGLIPGLIAKRFEMAVSAIYITDARKKVVDFTNTYYPGGLVVLTKKDDTSIAGPADLAGKKVSVQVGTKSVAYMAKNYPDAQLVEVEKNDEMFNLLKIGRVEAAVTGKPAAINYAKLNPEVKVLPKQVTTEEYGMAVRKDLPELTAGLNKALEEVKADGTYDALVKKWFGEVK
ncbi:amino acid ABC transporter substrate-binding protein (PAAT family) [Breoghania corrubedonensis]|uniref:Amino acid ABC transporter substrate-binding protein (PAAT family) n=1 Tax=Breoghania corrubedonensis TaxID=665038 RepID=A0A2T5V6E1_9HYPH|nr:transporter substrate-binding domain-containing protein [Breoghania corrubedonensis]PTW59320.1 amino acid ABC transporter substrate-binding protein (PAAT family) [Breoghania corrubedonensis]